MDKGILYIGTNKGYLEQAAVSARSARKVSHIPIAVITNSSLRTTAESMDCFDSVVTVPDCKLHDDVRDKVHHMGKSPFDRTLYLDGDTSVLKDISQMFEMLDRVDLAGSQAPIRPVVELETVPHSFTELNTGVLLFDSSPEVEEVFSDWRENLREQIEHGRPDAEVSIGGDSLDDIPFGRYHGQPPFREAIYMNDIHVGILPPEYNFRGLERVFGPVYILHNVADTDRDKLRRKVNENEGGRVYIRERGTMYYDSGRSISINNNITNRLYWLVADSDRLRNIVEKTGLKKPLKSLLAFSR
ncbi:hypothetical protein GCM10028857_29120 [Salinarchaeum chitinilyticum]